MELYVKIFGPQALLAETRACKITITGDRTSAAEVLKAVADAYPSLASSIESSRLAVNQEFASPEQPVMAQDELALIGMISGG